MLPLLLEKATIYSGKIDEHALPYWTFPPFHATTPTKLSNKKNLQIYVITYTNWRCQKGKVG